jgi:hypothetical protein
VYFHFLSLFLLDKLATLVMAIAIAACLKMDVAIAPTLNNVTLVTLMDPPTDLFATKDGNSPTALPALRIQIVVDV